MSELLFEIFSEEIPARMQDAAAKSLTALVTDELKKASLTFGTVTTYYTPRRLAVSIADIPSEQKSYVEEIKGPPTSSAQQAIDGFLRKNSLASVADCVVRKIDTTEYYFFEKKFIGGKTIDILGALLTSAIEKMNWPKSMRWGNSTFRWARPMHSILAIFDGSAITGQLNVAPDFSVPFGNQTLGHRFMSDGKPMSISSLADYKAKLTAAGVILDQAERRAKIWADVQAVAAKEGFTVKQDEKLLNEVNGLVEYPVPFMGQFPEDFLTIPAEVISTSMREHQRYFSVLDKNGKLVNRFICVANVQPDDAGKTIIYGNEKVLRARLSDAGFFWDLDKKTKLADFMPQLEKVRFHEKLGTMAEKALRLQSLAEKIATAIGADAKSAGRAAWLSKADLVTSMVREFPEIQGIMGGYYARLSGEGDEVAAAISSHYSPAGPQDSCPSAPISIAVALADKIDTIVGFFSIGEKPTGNKDPFALRRAALGIIRLIVDNNLTLSLGDIFEVAAKLYGKNTPDGLKDFVAERFRVSLTDDKVSAKLIDAVLTGDNLANLTKAKKKATEIAAALETNEGAAALAIIKRVVNILDSAQKSAPVTASKINEELLTTDEEKTLFAKIADVAPRVECLISDGAYRDSVIALSQLQEAVTAFFDKVVVVDKDEAIRANRISLLLLIKSPFDKLADFAALIR